MRWLIVAHLSGVVLWMGGLLTLSRILGYHAREHATVRPRYSWLEGRLNYLVTIPGAVIVLGTGAAQVWIDGAAYFKQATWLHWKLLLVFVVLIIHFVLTLQQRRIASRSPDEKINRPLFAALHGTLGLLMIGIIALAILK